MQVETVQQRLALTEENGANVIDAIALNPGALITHPRAVSKFKDKGAHRC